MFLFLIDRSRRTAEPDTLKNSYQTLSNQFGQRISSVATLALSLIIPMVTMGLVWPWTGPAASATLAPYLVGIVVQFAFEQYARRKKSCSWPVIPIVFQVRIFIYDHSPSTSFVVLPIHAGLASFSYSMEKKSYISLSFPSTTFTCP